MRFFTEPFASEDDAAAALAGFDVILATRERTPFPKSLIDRLPALRMFGLTGMRAGKIDLAYLQQRGVVVCYTDGGPGVESTAELALALMLAAARRIPRGRVVGARGPLPARHADRLRARRQDARARRPRAASARAWRATARRSA